MEVLYRLWFENCYTGISCEEFVWTQYNFAHSMIFHMRQAIP
uniref:Uncharacterized protein n=1 Tax=Arundo donax TaxID=35708 RepID=A0A0A9B7A0_ARUDO